MLSRVLQMQAARELVILAGVGSGVIINWQHQYRSSLRCSSGAAVASIHTDSCVRQDLFVGSIKLRQCVCSRSMQCDPLAGS